MSNVSVDDMIRCVKREIAMRKKVYAKRVLADQMDGKTADREIELMTAVLHFILEKSGRREHELF